MLAFLRKKNKSFKALVQNTYQDFILKKEDCLLQQFHFNGIPMNDFFREITFITCQGRSGRSKAESGIFYNRFPCSDRIKEISKVI